MDIADVNELRTKGGMMLLESMASYGADNNDFLNTYYEIKEKYGYMDNSSDLNEDWAFLESSLEDASLKTDKEAEQRAWQAFVDAQRENKKLLEEMLIARRMRELERIATRNGRVLTNVPYFRGISAADILSTIM